MTLKRRPRLRDFSKSRARPLPSMLMRMPSPSSLEVKRGEVNWCPVGLTHSSETLPEGTPDHALQSCRSISRPRSTINSTPATSTKVAADVSAS